MSYFKLQHSLVYFPGKKIDCWSPCSEFEDDWNERHWSNTSFLIVKTALCTIPQNKWNRKCYIYPTWVFSNTRTIKTEMNLHHHACPQWPNLLSKCFSAMSGITQFSFIFLSLWIKTNINSRYDWSCCALTKVNATPQCQKAMWHLLIKTNKQGDENVNYKKN